MPIGLFRLAARADIPPAPVFMSTRPKLRRHRSAATMSATQSPLEMVKSCRFLSIDGRAHRERHELAPWRRKNAGDVAAGRALISDKPRLASDRVNPHNLFHWGLATQARNVLSLFGPGGRHDAHTLPATLQVITHACVRWLQLGAFEIGGASPGIGAWSLHHRQRP